MNQRLHFVGQGFVDLSLALNEVHPLESRRDDDDLKVPATGFPRTGVARVRRALVDHVEFDDGGKRF